MRNNFLQKSCRKESRETNFTPLLVLLKSLSLKQVDSILVLIYFGRPLLEHTTKTNCVTFKTDDPEICSKRVWDSIIQFMENSISIVSQFYVYYKGENPL